MREAINTVDAPGAEQGWLDWLAAHGVPGIAGVDTRALVRHIRSAGAMRGGIFPPACLEVATRASSCSPSPRWWGGISRAR